MCIDLAKSISDPLQVFAAGANLIHQAHFCNCLTLKKVVLNFKDGVLLNSKIKYPWFNVKGRPTD